ncbi:MAG: LytR/AlgR family response regulator transcription factor [Thermincolia bacterium]
MNEDKLNIAIIDDEATTRQLIRFYLSSFPHINIVAEASNGTEIIKIWDSLNPTAVFLDIEMDGPNGLCTAAMIKDKVPEVLIVFITGHTKYAADAYQLEAIDYLLKPVTKESTTRAINRIEKILAINKKTDPTVSVDRIVVKNKLWPLFY